MSSTKKDNSIDGLERSTAIKSRYIDVKINGRLFPTWVLANFRKYKLAEIVREEGKDPCNIKTKRELRVYQNFLSSYLDFKSPYRNILIYHGLGSGKTASAINIYNALYAYTPGWNVFLMIKASLRNNPWMKDLEDWLKSNEKDFRMANIHFVHYDAPNADKQYSDAVKKVDSSKKSLYIIDEVHNFIRNVYSNISSTQGKRAQSIYEAIIQDKRENSDTRVVALSGTPAINTPYELALLFNLLRPGTFPKSENEFNHLYVSSSGYPTINEANKNMFQRRITGLVSFYIGATPDLYATKKDQPVDVVMSKYQREVYSYFEDIEETIAKRSKMRGKKGSSTYKSYTRQSCNFVFPFIDQKINGEARPRPSKFRVSEKVAEKISENRTSKEDLQKVKKDSVNAYMNALDKFTSGFDNFLAEKAELDKKQNYTFKDDLEVFKKLDKNFEKFREQKKISNLVQNMIMCSAKITNMCFNILTSPGSVLIYSNYVLMEGLEIVKIYLKYFEFANFLKKPKEHHGYAEFHGGIDPTERARAIEMFNKKDNIRGEKIKIMMISPAGAEGISLFNVRQVHLLEPYWHEVRMTQMIGRAVRQCSHKDLPMNERHVDIFRYKSIRGKNEKWTTDQQIENIARSKDSLIQSFLDTVKEAAIDCMLNRNHNMMMGEYRCFQFDEPSLFDQHIGPAYKDDTIDDMKINNGLNSPKSMVTKIKVMKISAVKKLTDTDKPEYSEPTDYWFSDKSGVVYDLELKFPIGKVSMDDNNVPNKLNKDVYIIDHVIPIPMINGDI
uniref:Helicase C-terminal domain-containing protein n=1 Tax=viral metagenome TaxID=1070528 RepID=A0A6C0AD50_9ZZZZ